MGLLDVILIVNVILKLVGVIDWGWPIVLWPVWVALVIILIIKLD